MRGRSLYYRLPTWAVKECYRIALMAKIKESVDKAKEKSE